MDGIVRRRPQAGPARPIYTLPQPIVPAWPSSKPSEPEPVFNESVEHVSVNEPIIHTVVSVESEPEIEPVVVDRWSSNPAVPDLITEKPEAFVRHELPEPPRVQIELGQPEPEVGETYVGLNEPVAVDMMEDQFIETKPFESVNARPVAPPQWSAVAEPQIPKPAPAATVVKSHFDHVDEGSVTDHLPESFAGAEKMVADSFAESTMEQVPLSRVVPNPYQPRRQFDELALKELAVSMLHHGLIQPIVVTETSTGNYELVAGERRYRAAQLAGMITIPAIVKRQMKDQSKLELALIENIQRQELNPIEEALAYKQLIDKFGFNHEDISKKVGRARPTISNTLRLLNLAPELQQAVIHGQLSEGQARAILALPDKQQQLELGKQVMENGWNVRQVEAKARGIMGRQTKRDLMAPDVKISAIESQLRGLLGTQVKISKKGDWGKITIEFFSDEELANIVNRVAADQLMKAPVKLPNLPGVSLPQALASYEQMAQEDDNDYIAV